MGGRLQERPWALWVQSHQAPCPHRSLFLWLVFCPQHHSVGPSTRTGDPRPTAHHCPQRSIIVPRACGLAGACFQDPGDLAAGAVPPRAERQAAHWCPAEQRGGRFVPSGHATLGTLSHLVVTAAGCHAVLHVGQEGVDEPHVAPHGLAASVGRAQVPEGEGRQQWGTRSRVRGHDGRADLGGGAADRTGG